MIVALVAGSTRWAHAVVVADPQGRNLGAPSGTLLDAWNLQGQYGTFNGTPISPTQYLVANHVGDQGGLAYAGQYFPQASWARVPNSDLRVCTIDTAGGTRAFPSYAPLYDPIVDGPEAGKPLVVFGRGTARGAAILGPIDPGTTLGPVARPLGSLALTGGGQPMLAAISGPLSPSGGEPRGWQWGAGDGQQSWGQNLVDSVVADSLYGDLLSFDFDVVGDRVANEAALSVGDSSGGVFIRSNGVWKLAGINLGVDGAWSLSANGAFENAAISDSRGLWVGNAAGHEQVPYQATALAASSYATRIGSHLTDLRALTANAAVGGNGVGLVPEPVSVAGLFLITPAVARRRRR